MQQFAIATTGTRAGSGLDAGLAGIDETELNPAQLLELAIDSQRLESFAAARRIEALAAFGESLIVAAAKAQEDQDAASPAAGGPRASGRRRNSALFSSLDEAPIRFVLDAAGRPEMVARPFRDEALLALPRYSGDEVAAALGLSATQGQGRLLDAMFAVACFPRCTEALKAAKLDLVRHRFLIEKARHLPPSMARQLDAEVAGWPEGLSRSQFNGRVRARVQIVDQEGVAERHARVCRERDVMFLPDDDGAATLIAKGPADGLRALFNRLDAVARSGLPGGTTAEPGAARAGDGAGATSDETVGGTARLATLDGGAVSSSDRAAAEALAAWNGTVVALDGRTLAQRRFDALTGAEIGDTAARRLLGRQAKVAVTVPYLTLMGYLDLPGQMEGYGPIPADMARALAGEAKSWSRILLDPVSGGVREVDRWRYRPVAPVAAFVRERHRSCTAPGCNKPAERCELDHLRPFNHADPKSGGPTDPTNLHPACRYHHDGKTRGLLHAERVDPGGDPTGAAGATTAAHDPASPEFAEVDPAALAEGMVIRWHYPSGRYYDVCEDSEADITAAGIRFAQGLMAEANEPSYDPDDPLGEKFVAAELERMERAERERDKEYFRRQERMFPSRSCLPEGEAPQEWWMIDDEPGPSTGAEGRSGAGAHRADQDVADERLGVDRPSGYGGPAGRHAAARPRPPKLPDDAPPPF